MVRIRLKRLGRKKKPFYRVVVVTALSRRDGSPLAELGYYNPITKELKLDMVAVKDWIAKGAQPSDTVKTLIAKAPESNELVRLDVAKKEKLSKKAQQKQAAQAAEA